MTTRRSFFKLGGAAAAAGMAGATAIVTEAQTPLLRGGKDFSPRTGKERAAVPSACWQCVSRCPAGS